MSRNYMMKAGKSALGVYYIYINYICGDIPYIFGVVQCFSCMCETWDACVWAPDHFGCAFNQLLMP